MLALTHPSIQIYENSGRAGGDAWGQQAALGQGYGAAGAGVNAWGGMGMGGYGGMQQAAEGYDGSRVTVENLHAG